MIKKIVLIISLILPHSSLAEPFEGFFSNISVDKETHLAAIKEALDGRNWKNIQLSENQVSGEISRSKKEVKLTIYFKNNQLFYICDCKKKMDGVYKPFFPESWINNLILDSNVTLLRQIQHLPSQEAVLPEHVRFSTDIDLKSCVWITQDTCKTSRSKSAVRCQNWHKKRAAYYNANTIEILTSNTQNSGAVAVSNVAIAISASSMMANYYRCSKEQKSELSNKNSNAPRDIASQLREVTEMYKSGLLTEQEFTNAKSKILDD